jgi:hypothetical protein
MPRGRTGESHEIPYDDLPIVAGDQRTASELPFLKHFKKTIHFPQAEAGLSLPSRPADLSPLFGGLIRKKQSMKKGQRRARRMALYLSSIGVQLAPSAGSYKQWAAVLQAQYNALEGGQRKLARQAGRRLLKESGSIAIAVGSLTNPAAIQPLTVFTPVAALTRSREEQFDYIRRRWSALTPPCPSCRMRNGFPKRSWPTRKWADEVWARQHDRETLRVYECPIQSGFWHLGHIRPPVASVVVPNGHLVPPLPTPGYFI